MRRMAVFSGLVLVCGLLGPSTAFAGEDDGHDNGKISWIAVEDHFAVVLPDGETFTGDDEPGDEEEAPPVGTRLFISEQLYATDDGETRGDAVGRTHIECTAQVVEFTFLCDAAFVFDTGSQLVVTVHIDFSDPSLEGTPFVIAVTGGTGDFFGAAGEVTSTDISESPDEAVSLYEADFVLPHK